MTRNRQTKNHTQPITKTICMKTQLSLKKEVATRRWATCGMKLLESTLPPFGYIRLIWRLL